MDSNKIITSLKLVLLGILIPFFCGEVSQYFAMWALRAGIGFPIREILNFGLAFLFFFGLKNYFLPILKSQLKISTKFSILGFVIIIIILSITWSVFIATNSISFKSAKSLDSIVILGLFLSALFLILHAAAEQIIIRFLAQKYFEENYGVIYSFLICGFMFAALQFLQEYRQPIYMLNSFLFGVLIAILARKFGIFSAILCHATWTWAELSLLPAIYEYKIIDRNWFGIGTDSYGSMVFSTICILFCIISLFLPIGEKISLNYKAKYD